ncbi:MAG: FAD:protein FMN transferase [Opitutaceae bacterium]|nr:FAD:protein FMN transferase [Opitutaceae bacterium]
MATVFEVRLAGEEPAFAAQAAHAAFEVLDKLEALLSRFHPGSEIAALSRLAPGEALQLSEPTAACLALALDVEQQTGHAFSLAATASRTGRPPARWTLDPATLTVTVHEGPCLLDLGAIGKGFALDRMAAELREWGCPSFLLVAGGSSVLAGDPPPGSEAWTARLSDPAHPEAPAESIALVHTALGSSGLALQGNHITDPRTGQPVTRRRRTWVRADSAAEADAFSTALMVLDEAGTATLAAQRPDLKTWITAA